MAADPVGRQAGKGARPVVLRAVFAVFGLHLSVRRGNNHSNSHMRDGIFWQIPDTMLSGEGYGLSFSLMEV